MIRRDQGGPKPQAAGSTYCAAIYLNRPASYLLSLLAPNKR